MVLPLGFAACTLILDRNSSQCHVDGDCASLGSQLRCQDGACVSGASIGQPGCFTGSPQTEQQFLNQCTPAQCYPFDRCAHNVCDAGAVDIDGGVLPIVKGDGGTTGGGGPGADAGAPSEMPLCFDPSAGRGSVVYITGSSNFPPLLAKLAPLLADPTAGGYTPVYRITSSCDGVRSMLGASASDHLIFDPPAAPNAPYATYFTAEGMAVPCSLGPEGATVDVGESDIFSTSCSGFTDPSDSVEHVPGPIQAMAFVVPGNSTQNSITAEAAFAVFGRGGKNGTEDLIYPWDTPSLYYIRNANTGTQQMIGRAIHVPADQFWGVDRGTAKKVADTLPLLDPTQAEKAIGIISVDYYDANRMNLKALAFQGPGQSCAYLPDSSPFAMDKRNVRDGHYPIWGPLHFFAAAQNGAPVSTAALAFLTVATGVLSAESASDRLLDAYIDASLVPTCAMTVQRSSELGSLTPFAPRGECGCYFETRATKKAPTECVACAANQDCADPIRPFCSHGFCEVQ
jgi:ABC-type phosphate transport system substrate-binding protein